MGLVCGSVCGFRIKGSVGWVKINYGYVGVCKGYASQDIVVHEIMLNFFNYGPLKCMSRHRDTHLTEGN